MKPGKIGIIGAGPAGAFLGFKLAEAGLKVSLFDHRAPWEKPCAGGLDPIIWTEFPELTPIQSQAYANRKARVVTTNKIKIDLDLTSPLYVISRKNLARFLIELARSAGAAFLPRKIIEFQPADRGFELKDDQKQITSVDFLVGADGAASLVRKKFCRPWDKSDYYLTLSLWLPKAVSLPLTVQFFDRLAGYAWIFPGKDSTSIGLGSWRRRHETDDLLSFCESMIDSEPELSPFKTRLRPEAKRALIPALKFSTLCRQKVVGQNWALVGDASGAAHSVTGEGIYYSLKTAALLAQAIISGRAQDYQHKWRGLCKKELVGPSLWGPLFLETSAKKIMLGYLPQSESARRVAIDFMSCSRPGRFRMLLNLLKMLAGG